MNAKDAWMKQVEYNRKRLRGLPRVSLNPDAGNVEYNISMFNKMNSGENIAVNPVSGPFGGDIGVGESYNPFSELNNIEETIDPKFETTYNEDCDSIIYQEKLNTSPIIKAILFTTNDTAPDFEGFHNPNGMYQLDSNHCIYYIKLIPNERNAMTAHASIEQKLPSDAKHMFYLSVSVVGNRIDLYDIENLSGEWKYYRKELKDACNDFYI